MARRNISARVQETAFEHVKIRATLDGVKISAAAAALLEEAASKQPHSLVLVERFRALEAEHGEGKVTPVMLLVQS